MNTFVVTNAKLINKNSLIGRFDLEMPSGMVIRDMLLLESGGRRWCNFPSEKYEKSDGSISPCSVLGCCLLRIGRLRLKICL
jgi:hypothetical protein